MIKVTNTYLNGKIISNKNNEKFELINPANEKIYGFLECSTIKNVETAISSAKQSQHKLASLDIKSKINILRKILNGIENRRNDFAEAISLEMGAPIKLSLTTQIDMGLDHLKNTIDVLKDYRFEQTKDGYSEIRVPIGVVGLITPWNWPLNQTLTKIASSIAAGCPIIIKPSEYSPLSMRLLIEVMHESNIPDGGFNVVNGIGSKLGPVISQHPDISMISFTGSTEVGIQIQQQAAQTIKRVSLELGGKSAHIVCDDVDLKKTIPMAINQCFINSGQSCSAPTRLLVPRNKLGEVKEVALEHINTINTGDPLDPVTDLGPVVNKKQYNNVQRFIDKGINQSIELLCGGLGRPDKISEGFYIKPSIFADVSNKSFLAQEEIFGPVLVIICYTNIEEAISITNDSKYGLSSYISCSNIQTGYEIAKKIQAGQTIINKISRGSVPAPFGGFKMSGNGREHGIYGLEDYLEVKAII